MCQTQPSHLIQGLDEHSSFDVAHTNDDISLVPRPHLAHVRRRGLLSQVQILGPAEVLKPFNY